MAFGSKLQFESGSWMEAVYDTYIGIVVGASHFLYLSSRFVWANLLAPILSLFGFEVANSTDDREKNTEGLKVVAVGYGRTGTVSRRRACASPIVTGGTRRHPEARTIS